MRASYQPYWKVEKTRPANVGVSRRMRDSWQPCCDTCAVVSQVIDWLDTHGEVFLTKNTAVGKSLQRAKALQKSHEHFENVAQVSYIIIVVF